MRYPALIDGERGAYGVVFPDIEGIAAMGETLEEAILNGAAVLQDYAIEMERDGLALVSPSALEDIEVPAGCALTSIVLVPAAPDKPSVRLNITLDAGDCRVYRLGVQAAGHVAEELPRTDSASHSSGRRVTPGRTVENARCRNNGKPCLPAGIQPRRAGSRQYKTGEEAKWPRSMQNQE